jgi:DNA processing protein
VSAQNPTDPIGGGFTPDEIAARLELIQYAGQLDQGEGPRVAVIGARACSPYGEHVAADLAAEFTTSGVCVAATFAYGIDSAALRGALAAQGRVLGVATQNLEVAYPKGHATLQERVMAEGLAVSVHPEARTPTRQRFLLTLTILAHIVDAVVLVEAGPHSNTFATVNEARRIGKPVYAVPGPITSGMSRGTNELLRSRKARVLTCADDLKLPLLVSEPVA